MRLLRARFLAAACGILLTGVLLQQGALQGALEVILGAVAVAIGVSVVKYRPARRSVWLAMDLVVILYFVSYGLRMWAPSLSSHAQHWLTFADFLDLCGLCVAVGIGHAVGKTRPRYRDFATILDACIVTGGMAAAVWFFVVVPDIQASRATPTVILLHILSTAVALVLAFVVSRLAMASQKKSPSSIMLIAAGAFGVVSRFGAIAEGTAVGILTLITSGLCVALIGAAALYPSATQAQLVKPNASQISWKRFVGMTIAVMVAPCMLLYQFTNDNLDRVNATMLVVTWIMVTALVMVRLAGLIRARERMVKNEMLLRLGATRLASASSIEEVRAAAMASFQRVADPIGNIERISILERIDDEFRVVDALGIEANHARERTATADMLKRCLGENLASVAMREHTLQPDIDSSQLRSVTAVPFGIKPPQVGMLLVTSIEPLRQETIDALILLASDIGSAIAAVALAQDVRRRESEARFQALVRNTTDVTAVIDERGIVRYVTPSVSFVLGRSPDALIGKSIDKLIMSDDLGVVYQLISLLLNTAKTQTYAEVRAKASDGEVKYLELTISDYRDEHAVNGLVMNAHDITERKKLEEDMRHQVLHDGLTGIANRLLFAERLQHALQSRRSDYSYTAVLVIDIDDFKTVNDGLGHGAGDELLRVIAFRLEAFVRTGDTAARLGSDVFALLMEEIPTIEAVEAAVTRLREVLQEPMSFQSRDVQITASFGITMTKSNDATADEMLRNADVAMHHAKQAGKNRVRVFDESMHQSAFERLELKGELGCAIERNELFLVYQPLVETHTLQLRGFEALLRWNHPTRGMVNPMSFIPLAEETGLIGAIGKWVAEQAIAQLALWNSYRYSTPLSMSINVAPRQLEERNFAERMQNFVDDANIARELITFEITETANIDAEKCQQIEALRAAKFGIAADDFGTGFANYASLRQIPFTEVKIDRSLINGLDGTEHAGFVQIRSIIEMGHALGMKVTAEGVEERVQFNELVKLDVDTAQGWLFGKPVVADEAKWWVTGEKSLRTVESLP